MYDVEFDLDIGGAEFEFGCDYTYTPAIPASCDEPASDEEFVIDNLVMLIDVDKNNRRVPHDVFFMLLEEDFYNSVIDIIKES